MKLLLKTGIITVTFLLSLDKINAAEPKLVSNQQSEYYLSKCGEKFGTLVVVINFNSDKTVITRLTTALYNSSLVYRGVERNNWYTSGTNFPSAIFSDPQKLKLITTSEDVQIYSFNGFDANKKYHSESVSLISKNNSLSEIIATYQKDDGAFSAKDFLRCYIDKKLTSLDMLKMNHLDIYKYPLGGPYSNGRKLYRVRYADLGYYAKQPETLQTNNSWSYILPGIYTIKISKLIQKPFHKPKWIELYKKEFQKADDFRGMNLLEFDQTITDKFYPEDKTRLYPGGDRPETTIVIDENDWHSDLKIDLSVSRELDGVRQETNESVIIN